MPLGLTELLRKCSDNLNYVIGAFKKVFVGSLAELRIAAIRFIMSECQRGTPRLPHD